MFFALRCRVASLLCSRRLVVLAVACSVEDSSRCFVASLSSVCPRRRVCCARRRCCSLASWPLLLHCCAHTPCHACCCVRRRCSDAMFFALRCRLERFARPMHAPCAPVVPCPVPWPVVAGVWVPWSRSGRGACPWGAPLPCGLFSVEGVGCFLVGIKITPRPSSWKVDGVGVHFMLTNSIHPEGGNCEVLSPHLRWLGHRAVANVASQSLGLYDGCAIERGGVELVLMIEDVPGDTGCISPRLGLCVAVVVVKD